MSLEILSTDPDRPGIFAVGQLAYGVFALGQLSTGVVAIGQVARGVIAVGQGAVGIVAIGQGALGVVYAGGMMAVGGRGFGICLKMLPEIRISRHRRPTLPPLSTIEELSSGMDNGWLLTRIVDGELVVDGRTAPVDLDAAARAQLEAAVAAGHNHACLTVNVEERVIDDDAGGYRRAADRERILTCPRLSSWFEGSPRVHLEGPLRGVGGLVLRAIGMCALGVAWWLIAGRATFALFS